jgi:hypothetical protein
MDDWHLGWIIKLRKTLGYFFFFFDFFFNRKIWLNWLMDDWHLGWIIKLRKKNWGTFFLSFFNSQILLNLLMDDCHISYLAKLPKKTHTHTHTKHGVFTKMLGLDSHPIHHSLHFFVF